MKNGLTIQIAGDVDDVTADRMTDCLCREFGACPQTGKPKDFAMSDGQRLLQEFRIADEISLTSIAGRMPGRANKTVDKARASAVESLRRLKPLLSATPGTIVIFDDGADPQHRRIPDRHKVVLEIGERGERRWNAVSQSPNGWATKREANDYSEARFMVFLTELPDNEETEFAGLVGIDESKLILNRPSMPNAAPMDFSNSRPAAGRRTDAQVAASLRSRGIDPSKMPRSR